MKANQIIARALQVIDSMDKADASWNQEHPFQHKDRVPLLILSHPGYGKTSTVRKWCEYKDYNLFTLIPSQNAADDILGLNTKSGDNMVRLTPPWYNRLLKTVNENGKRTVLFIDEISTCDPFIQGPLLNLIFNRSLGEAVLPDNVMVVAAGNYAEDLHNAFEMNEALVNRFMILNLYRKDFSIAEQVQGLFTGITERAELERYLGLKAESPVYDFEKFKEWLVSSRDIDYSEESKYTVDPVFGLRGFTSMRSLDFSLRFTQAYVNTYADKNWMRIVGDTLGSSDRRDGKAVRLILESEADEYFRKNKSVLSASDTLGTICQEIKESAHPCPSEESIGKLQAFIEGLPGSNKSISSADLSAFALIVQQYLGFYPVLKDLAKNLADLARNM